MADSKRDTLQNVWLHVLRMDLSLAHNNSGDVCEVLIGGDDMIGLQEAAERIRATLTGNTLAPDKAVDDLADALNNLKAKMGTEAWNTFVEMSHK